MMDPQREKELDELLARGGLSGPALERALEGALKNADRKPSRMSLLWRFGWLAPLAAVVASLVLFLRSEPEFRARGELVQEAQPRVELVCGDQAGTHVRCARSDRLYFSVWDTKGTWFLSSYAEPETAGERVWFFPTARESSIELSAKSGHAAAPRSVILEGVPVGRYRVALLVSRQPLTRAEALAAPHSQVASLQVVP